MKMEKYDIILDLIEHPEKYSQEKVREILSEPDIKYLYNMLCKTSSALNSNDQISEERIELEWAQLNSKSSKELCKRRPFIRRLASSSRVASFAVITLTSMAALAVGIIVSVSVVDNGSVSKHAEKPLEQTIDVTSLNDTTAISQENLSTEDNPVIFEDTPLEDILKTISEYYGVDVKFISQETAGIHLFYKFDSRQSIDDILEQLNTFDRIDIRKEGDFLIVE